MIIYKVTNKINGKIYIGQTSESLKRRWYRHCKLSYSNCRFLVRAINKYGKENFIVEEICKCSSIEEMNEREIFYIKELNSLVPSGYNLMTGGNNCFASDESKKKNSESQKISQNRPEVKQKRAKTWADKSFEEKEFIKKVQSENVRASYTIEVRNKVSEKIKKSWNDPIIRKNRIASANKPESKKKMIESHLGDNYPIHIRWHFNRGQLNLNCKHCIDQIMKEHS